MIDYINNHLAGFWIAAGFTLLAAEILLFGFSSIILLFSGLGALTTGLLIISGILPAGWIASVASFGISSGIISALLWAPLKKLQNRAEPIQQSHSDFIGLQFTLDQDITTTRPGHYRYSGIDWKVEIAHGADEQLHKGQRVQVVSIDVGIFRVSAVTD